jgi:signal transduction histidine kinase
LLQDQTNREGLDENRAYQDMRRFALHSVQYLERERSSRENRVALTEAVPIASPAVQVGELLERIAVDLDAVATDLTQATGELPGEDSLFYSSATQHVEASIGRIRQVLGQVQQTRTIHEDQQSEWQTLLGLATLGIAMATFGHETTRAVNNLLNRVEMVGEALKQLPELQRPHAERNLAVLREAAEQVEAWGQFALQHVRRDKRRRRDVDVNHTIEHVFEKFEGMLRARKVQQDLELAPSRPLLRAFPMDLEAILVNLITNALDAMQHTPLEKRRIQVKVHTDFAAGQIELAFADSGRGITAADELRVFDPLYSTKTDREGMPTGTGMGLTIIRHLVADYRGAVTIVGRGELGGATFSISLPLHQRK